MNTRKKSYKNFLLTAIFIYISLLIILYLVEHNAKGATIRTFGDAVWYSLVTLSTVGYGDLTPVTFVGHCIGLIFLVLAAGTLVTLLSTAVSVLSSEGLPLFLLRYQQSKNWYYFADCGVEAQTLAGNIVKEDENALIIFGEQQDEHQETLDFPSVCLKISPARIVKAKARVGTNVKVFLMKENDINSNTRAANLHTLPVEVYANSTNGENSLQGNINFFHAYDCCAREYWRTHPILNNEHTIVLIGFDYYGRNLLERAILTNVIASDQQIAYHVFGDPQRFLDLHLYLDQVFTINEEGSVGDSLIFHEDSWEKYHDLIARADRIIIALDDVSLGWDVFWRVKKYYNYNCRIDLRNNHIVPGASCFGTIEEIYTSEHIMRTNLNRVAIAMNHLYRESVNYKAMGWNQLPDFLKQSKIAAADHILQKIRILTREDGLTDLSLDTIEKAYNIYLEEREDPNRLEELRRIEYIRWYRFYIFNNWQYAPVRNVGKRQHPMLCPYEELTNAQKRERDGSWEILGSLGRELR